MLPQQWSCLSQSRGDFGTFWGEVATGDNKRAPLAPFLIDKLLFSSRSEEDRTKEKGTAKNGKELCHFSRPDQQIDFGGFLGLIEEQRLGRPEEDDKICHSLPLFHLPPNSLFSVVYSSLQFGCISPISFCRHSSIISRKFVGTCG